MSTKFERIGIERFKTALKRNLGNLSNTANELGVSRSRLYDYVECNPDWKEARRDMNGYMLDASVQTLFASAIGIKETDENGKMIGWRVRPDTNALCFLIKTLGRDEGFGEQKDAPAPDKGIDRININVTYNKKEDLEPQEKKS